jgi:hypothetical protein
MNPPEKVFAAKNANEKFQFFLQTEKARTGSFLAEET